MVVLFIKGLKVISIHGTSKSRLGVQSILYDLRCSLIFSVADYKYDDENDYGNAIYKHTADDGSRSWNFDQENGKPKPYLNFINSA